jgi:RHS repeat-associated protein
MFNAKELDEENGMYYYGARYYAPPMFISKDPLFEKKPWMSPYSYCRNNPMNRIDPTGMEDDWVQNVITKEYVWMDNVTGKGNTPNGYEHVGNKNEDILTHMNLPTNFSPISQNRVGVGLDEDKGFGAPIGTMSKISGRISVNSNVSYDRSNATENNSLGKQFEGVTFSATLTQFSVSGNSDLIMDYAGNFTVGYGNETYSSRLDEPAGSYIKQTGTIITTASVTIPARNINLSKSFGTANIKAGTLKPELMFQPRPINMQWNLRK